MIPSASAGVYRRIAPKDYYAEKRKWFSRTSHNLALYMGYHIGFLGGIMTLTDVPGILRWDCVATDWFHAPAYATFLICNPFADPKTVTLPVGPSECDLYDTVTGTFIARDVTGATFLRLAPDQVMVLVFTPPHGSVSHTGFRLLINDVVVDYQYRNSRLTDK